VGVGGGGGSGVFSCFGNPGCANVRMEFGERVAPKKWGHEGGGGGGQTNRITGWTHSSLIILGGCGIGRGGLGGEGENGGLEEEMAVGRVWRRGEKDGRM